ncbi:class I adenylate-forming enzyme family protein [Kordiimonas aquimaris]|uniref:class I adenylate-forming enzyme family protein n=1 Tax=Kordiimonas aquimaris TaxID=707591 RepID=UPI0021D30019|nr:class I adenylate-forming enzyme family protein [Kordiimonas aquimaris]
MLENLQLPEVDPATPIDDLIAMLTTPTMPFATTEAEVNGRMQTVFAHQPATMRDALMMFYGHGDREYLVYGDTRLTFAQTIEKASQFAQALVDDYGVKKGDRVALAMRNYPEWVIAYMGIVASGGIAVLMNAWWKSEELDWALKDCGAALAVTDCRRAEYMMATAEELDFKIIVARDEFTSHPRLSDFDAALEGKKPMAWPEVDMDTDDVVMMLYTSGSTGFPKGAPSTHRGVISVLFNWIVIALCLKMQGKVSSDPDFQPVMLVAVPFFHVTGLLPVAMVSAAVGRKLIIMHKWDVENAFQLIEKEGVTSFTGVPTMSYEFATNPLRKKYDLSTLSELGGGGAARPPEHVALIKKEYPNSNPGIGYGLTETNAMGALLAGEEYVERPNSVGRATPPLMSVKIVGDDGKECVTGDRGEICLKSVMNVAKYWNNPAATKAAFNDGWFHTGDVGYIDDEGYIFIVDRLKDIIIRGGENISSLEVEGVLHGIKGIDDVMVFSLPDKMLGEIVGTVVVTSDPALTPEKIIEETATHLAAYKLPAQIWLVDEPLPLIASGKIDRKNIKAYYQDLWRSETERNE